MDLQNLSKDDMARLRKFEFELSWGFQQGVSNLFNKAGKNEDLQNAATIDDVIDQKMLLREIFSSAADQATYAAVKYLDVFARVARRVGSDEELATCVPHVEKFDQGDVRILEKCGMNDTAAVLKAALKMG